MLCSDKTGTLTANKLSLNDPFIAPDVDPNWFMAVRGDALQDMCNQ